MHPIKEIMHIDCTVDNYNSKSKLKPPNTQTHTLHVSYPEDWMRRKI